MSSGSSPTSSRNTVPPWADSKRPAFAPADPVNAPFSCPKSSLSRSEPESAAQLMRSKGACARPEPLWMASAKTSLPVPVSPRTSTLSGLGAITSRSA